MKKLVGKDGFLYRLSFESAVNTGALQAKTWYKIKAKGVDSLFGETAVVGDIYYSLKGGTLKAGDSAIPLTLEKVAFVTDVPKSGSKEKFDVTTQIDEIKAYRASKRVEQTGSLNGYFTLGDKTVQDILSQFNVSCSIDNAGKATYRSISSETLHFLLSRNEDPTVGEIQVWEYMPMTFDSLTSDKPMDGVLPFTANYTLDGSERPSVIQFTQTA